MNVSNNFCEELARKIMISLKYSCLNIILEISDKRMYRFLKKIVIIGCSQSLKTFMVRNSAR